MITRVGGVFLQGLTTEHDIEITRPDPRAEDGPLVDDFGAIASMAESENADFPAIGPDTDERIDAVTGKLGLY